jgi:hypothetical protein
MSLSIVERLREVEDHADVGCAEAADTIEELVEMLRKCPHARECGVHSSLGICDCGRSALLAKIGGEA